jgi:hypothetical protein
MNRTVPEFIAFIPMIAQLSEETSASQLIAVILPTEHIPEESLVYWVIEQCLRYENKTVPYIIVHHNECDIQSSSDHLHLLITSYKK